MCFSDLVGRACWYFIGKPGITAKAPPAGTLHESRDVRTARYLQDEALTTKLTQNVANEIYHEENRQGFGGVRGQTVGVTVLTLVELRNYPVVARTCFPRPCIQSGDISVVQIRV